MKKLAKNTAAISILLLLFQFSQATIRRVGYFGPPITGVDYQTFAAAYTDAANADTILMMPGAAFDGTSVKKYLIIIGPGYFLDPSNATTPGNSGLQANPNTTSGSLFFYPGSDSSQIMGCNMNYVYLYGGNNILLKRCYVSSGVYFYASCSSIAFQQSWLTVVSTSGAAMTCSNINFLNCMIEYYISLGNTSSTFAGIVNNCIFNSPSGYTQYFGAGGWLIQNSIANVVYFSGTNLVYSNNIGTGTQFPSGNGNQQNQAWSTIFNLTGSYDSKYMLRTGSPALGTGTNGVDCGIFGGTAPYRLSGIPPIPTIYALSSPQGTTPTGNSIQINLSTRSNN